MQPRRALIHLLVALAVFQNTAVRAQDLKTPRTTDPKVIDEAVKKGAAFLVVKYWRALDEGKWNSNAELVMLALSRARVASEQSGFFQKVQEQWERLPLEYTYRVALLAMALESLDPVRYRDRIAHCAQWLVDTQMEDGEWSYPSKPIHIAAPLANQPEASSPTAPPSIVIRRHSLTVTRKDKGDISNTQFALLGLRACADAGIEIPKSTWESAQAYFRRTQNQDGGWGYCIGDAKPDASYGSITCAGVASLALCRSGMGGTDVVMDPAIRAGLKWIGTNFSPTANANIAKRNAVPSNWLYLYLYTVERVGSLLGLKDLGDQDWYASGAKVILEQQKGNGSWRDGSDPSAWTGRWDAETTDTCFAMLFLSRTTRAMRSSKDPAHD